MNIFDDFDLILSHFNKKEEPLFLNDIAEYAERHKNVVIETFSILLKSKDLNIQLKYLLLKSMGDLKYPEFVALLKDVLHQETRVQIIYETINSLSAIGSFHAYKIIVDFLEKNKKTEFTEKIEKSLRDVFIKNHLTFHFDVFYRDRGTVANIERSSEFLVKHLPDEYLNDLLPSISSIHPKLKFEALRIFKNRPKPVFYTHLFQFFIENYYTMDEPLFLVSSEALITCASQSKAKNQLFQKLKEIVQRLENNKKIIFCINLFKMNNKELIHYISAIYSQLNYEYKTLVLRNLNPDEYNDYKEFVCELLLLEPNEDLLGEILDILIRAKEFRYIFEAVDAEKGLRRSRLLTMIIERDPEGLAPFLQRYANPNQENPILRLSLEYLLKHSADKYFNLIKPIFFSGISSDIKTLIIRNVNKWNPLHQKEFMESVFKDINVILPFRKDFLFSLLGVLNEKFFDEDYEEKILNRILVLMEESPPEDIVNFVYFFDKYQVNTQKDKDLIIDELRLIQNTLLKASNDQNLVRMIHILIKNIEKKVKLKK